MRKAFFVVCSALIALASPALAQPLERGAFAGSINLGADFPVGGDVPGGAIAPIANLGPLNPALAGVSAELRIQSRSFDDIYGEANTFGLEGAYGLGSNRELFVAVGRTQADEARVQVGGAFVPALSATLPVFGQFGEFTSTSVEAGLRQYFGGEGALQPYVAGRVGAAFTDEIRATFTIPAASIAINNVAFYDDSTTFVIGADIGVSYAVTERFSIGAETGVRYTTGLEDNDTAIGGLGLARINDEGERLSIPVLVRARIAF